ncbi:MAG: Holliday junction branch migration protein RuvA [bacterium]|nr:Holliday junction branch migration protein RuvA [bacterium]
MFFYIEGKIAAKRQDFLVIDLNGIGFKIFIPEQRMKNLNVGDNLKIFTDHSIKHEEKIEIYGFLTEQELELFQVLKKISGIGAKASLNLSIAGSLENLKQKLLNQDKDLLGNLKGIGTKKIQKILIELESKTLKPEIGAKINTGEKDVVDSLVAIGFSKKDVLEALKQISPDLKDNEEKTKEVLKILGAQK